MNCLMKIRFFVSAVPFVACLCLAATAQARVNIEPIITVGTEYHSNYWLAEEDELGVETYSIKPGVRLNYDNGKTIVDAAFILESYWYRDSDDPAAGVPSAEENDYVGYYGEFSGTTAVTDRITLGLDDTSSITRDVSLTDPLSNSTNREKYFINNFSPNAYYDFGNKFGLGARYTNLYIDYQEDGEDSVQNMGTFDLYYNLNTRSAYFLSYKVWAKDYDLDSSDYLSNQVKMNYSHQFNYFTVEAGAGYHHRSFSQDFDSLDLFAWNITVEGQDPPAPDTEPRAHMSMILGQNMNNEGDGDTYYTATRIEAEFGYVFMQKIDTAIKGYYQNSDYDMEDGIDTGRDDDTYSISALVAYEFWKHGTVSLEVGHRERDSNMNGESYNDNFGLLALEFGLDLGFL